MANNDTPTTERILATAAFLLAALAVIISLYGLDKANKALDRANQQVNNGAGAGDNRENLMRGTGQEEVLPPTEPPTQ